MPEGRACPCCVTAHSLGPSHFAPRIFPPLLAPSPPLLRVPSLPSPVSSSHVSPLRLRLRAQGRRRGRRPLPNQLRRVLPCARSLAPRDPSPYISLAAPEGALEHLDDPDSIVIPQSRITLKVNYPLARTFQFELRSASESGFTRRELVQKVSDLYKRIYREEDETASGPPAQSFSLNRGATNGRYGICMHDLDDLLLHTVIREADGKYSLGIDS